MLSFLEKQALRYQKYCPTLKEIDEVLYQEALDETGIVPIDSLTEFYKDSITWRGEKVELKDEGLVDKTEELLRVHEIAPGKKPEGVTRIIYENANSFTWRIEHEKQIMLKWY